MEDVLYQIFSFSVMFGYGLMLGIFLDLYRGIIKGLNIRGIMKNILDILFGIIAGLIGFIILIYTNWVNLRFYIILAILLGFGLYYGLKSRWDNR
ncbi:spore cortex biosynthesis protein YabQ [Halothermothrix orenii]|nr:spore cortex biosynthesis protein YabQ [Halothermothrix orenii]